MKKELSTEDKANFVGERLYECKLNKAKNRMTFFCPVCHDNHTHGVDISEDGPYEPTHRSAHCGDRNNRKMSSGLTYGYYVFHTGS